MGRMSRLNRIVPGRGAAESARPAVSAPPLTPNVEASTTLIDARRHKTIREVFPLAIVSFSAAATLEGHSLPKQEGHRCLRQLPGLLANSIGVPDGSKHHELFNTMNGGRRRRQYRNGGTRLSGTWPISRSGMAVALAPGRGHQGKHDSRFFGLTGAPPALIQGTSLQLPRPPTFEHQISAERPL